MKILFPETVLGILFVFASCAPNQVEEIITNDTLKLSAQKKKMNPGVISIHEPNLFPEGIEYDHGNDRFLVSSITTGTVGVVKDGEYTEWINDKDLISTIGLHVDRPRKRLLVTNADIGASKKSSEGTEATLAALAAYDLNGQRLFYADLGGLREGPHFANDVTVDQRGNAYVTDSFSGIIYKVDSQGNASVFYENPEFDASEDSFGFNGIDYDPRGYLLVSHLETNRILRFPIDDPTAYTTVELPVQLYSPDGLYLKNPNELLVVNNDQGGENGNVQTFMTRDQWESAELINEFNTPGVFPTTVTLKRNTPYVLYAYLHELLSGGSQEEFQIVKVE